jgi:tRNA pseudouridine13 synthase
MMNGSSSCFSVRLISREIEQRVASGDLHPSGPLWGRGKPTSLAEALELELAVLEDEGALRDGLERAGLVQERRALRLPVNRLNWCFIEAAALRLEFALPAGAYATSVLRELAQLKDACAPEADSDAQ